MIKKKKSFNFSSVLGSAIFHLIPSAFKLSEVEFFPHHSYLTISLVVWGGIYGFFVIERLLKIFMEVKNGKQVSLELLEKRKKTVYAFCFCFCRVADQRRRAAVARMAALNKMVNKAEEE